MFYVTGNNQQQGPFKTYKMAAYCARTNAIKYGATLTIVKINVVGLDCVHCNDNGCDMCDPGVNYAEAALHNDVPSTDEYNF
jgi:hypothetical protein